MVERNSQEQIDINLTIYTYHLEFNPVKLRVKEFRNYFVLIAIHLL